MHNGELCVASHIKILCLNVKHSNLVYYHLQLSL